ncbi:serine/threonine-protein kinase [Rhabdothermincola salaria]|uniref:serine/threonine-protein kinase n=1 Tax=Rhabdothermincola salaria TaxID=2903142 RepID=UPI001E39C15B|nr:serine/threonine-protein kinase [Rhabdothermincola salaria]MCD9624829.1 serine/threonine protein kinase [Rhabdothermincola salaria]
MIADYTLIRPLGPSTYGDLYLAAPPGRLAIDADQVVVKVLPEVAAEREFDRFAREMQALASVQDSHVVSVLDAGHAAGRLFYAFSYLPLGTLSAHLVEGLASELPQAVPAVRDAALGAHALHEAGIIHRDISPRTIYVTDDGGILGDLGLAEVLRPGMTSTGIGPIGGLEYTDTALLRGERMGRSSDIWSLGATLHRVATGESVRPDLPSGDIVTVIRHALSEPPVIADSCPAALRPVIEQAMDPDPAARYADALELARAIDDAESRR